MYYKIYIFKNVKNLNIVWGLVSSVQRESGGTSEDEGTLYILIIGNIFKDTKANPLDLIAILKLLLRHIRY